MRPNNQFSESEKIESGKVQSVFALASAIKDAFKKISRQRRKPAWNAIVSKKGEKEINLLINNPERSINNFRLLANFKEWLNNNP